MRPKRIFISHSWSDKPLARRLARRFGQCGCSVFIDEDVLQAGDILPRRLRNEVKRSTHVILVWTQHAASSTWVAHEIRAAETAIFRRPKVVPLLAGGPKTHPITKRYIGIDFTNSSQFESNLQSLCDAIGIEYISNPSVQVAQDALNRTREESQATDRIVAAFSKERAMTITHSNIPTLGDPEWHAVDFGLQMAATIKLAGGNDTSLGTLSFAFCSAAVGYPALAAYWRRSNADRSAILNAVSAVSESNVWSWDRLLDLIEDWSSPDFIAIHNALQNSRNRLTPNQAQRFFDWIEKVAPGPGNWVADTLYELERYDGLVTVCSERRRRWLDAGLYDGADGNGVMQTPGFYFDICADLSKIPQNSSGRFGVEWAAIRTKRMLRSQDRELVAAAVGWAFAARTLKGAARNEMAQAIKEGVTSSEWNQWNEEQERSQKLASLLLDCIADVTSRDRKPIFDEFEFLHRANLIFDDWGLERRLRL